MKFKTARMAFGVKKNKMVFDENLMKGLAQIGKKLNSLSHAHKTRSANGSLIEVPIT
jgi:hypothetical protein